MTSALGRALLVAFVLVLAPLAAHADDAAQPTRVALAVKGGFRATNPLLRRAMQTVLRRHKVPLVWVAAADSPEAFQATAQEQHATAFVVGRLGRFGNRWYVDVTVRDPQGTVISEKKWWGAGAHRVTWEVQKMLWHDLVGGALKKLTAPPSDQQQQQQVATAPTDTTTTDTQPTDTTTDTATTDPQTNVADATPIGEDEKFDFGDSNPSLSTTTAPSKSRGKVLGDISGFARSTWGVWLERKPRFAKARQSFDAVLKRNLGPVRAVLGGHVEYDLAYEVEKEKYDKPTVDQYRYLVDTRDAYLALEHGPVEVAAGRQIVAWGVMDILTNFDVVNPHDIREPGEADLDDLRLPVLSTRFSYAKEAHRLDLIAVHEARFSYRSPPFGPYSPVPSVFPTLPPAPFEYQHEPDRFSSKGQQVFGRYEYFATKFDAGLYGAYMLDQLGVIVPPQPMSLEIPLDHKRYGLAGASLAVPWSSLVINVEAATTLSRSVTTLGPMGFPMTEKLSGANVGVGVSRLGTKLIASLEVSAGRYFKQPKGEVLAFDPALAVFEAPAAAARVQYHMLRDDDLELEGIGVVFGAKGERGWLARARARYRLFQAVWLEALYITYHPGDELGPFTGTGADDRVTAGLRWDFTSAY